MMTGEVLEPDLFEIVAAPVGADFGENRKDAFSQIISVKEIHVPTTFSALNLQSDLAILELRKPVVFNDFVLPVCYLPPFYTDYPTQGLLGKVGLSN
ncbi:unnamed protein product [Allacma fusca]|uniref:Peptidase S1 domain-containing protein n=1 Tax=Allacma fusca TaxID=39272 RepID=A0A8J2PR95_9HEXA|nr:unnamed protein product [Allacma fusca]